MEKCLNRREYLLSRPTLPFEYRSELYDGLPEHADNNSWMSRPSELPEVRWPAVDESKLLVNSRGELRDELVIVNSWLRRMVRLIVECIRIYRSPIYRDYFRTSHLFQRVAVVSFLVVIYCCLHILVLFQIARDAEIRSMVIVQIVYCSGFYFIFLIFCITRYVMGATCIFYR